MNERQIELRDFLVNNPTWHKQQEIRRHVGGYQGDKDYGRMLRKDFRALNMNAENEYIFISSNKGYKVASSKEATKYIKTVQKIVLRKLKLYNTICAKMCLNGQLEINGEDIRKICTAVD